MPNWVYNTLTITPLVEYKDNKKTLIQKIQRKLEKKYKSDGKTHEGFSFHNIIKMPQNKWDYDWCLQNWGCKWDAVADDDDDGAVVSNCSESDEELIYSFKTPWGEPSLEMLTLLCKEFPISIQLCWEEEQGYGQVLTFFKDMVFVDEEWEDTCCECGERVGEDDMCKCEDEDKNTHCQQCCEQCCEHL